MLDLSIANIQLARERHTGIGTILADIVAYLKSPTLPAMQRIREDAEAVDNISIGYWQVQTHIASSIEARVQKLREGEKNEWLALLASATDFPHFQELRDLSPFGAGSADLFDQ